MQAAQQPQGGGSRDTAIPFTHQRALIPASTIEFPTQRLYATSAFILLQALKLYDVYLVYTAHYPETQSSKLLKWWIADCVYLLVLWIMQIPWLQFSKFKTIALGVLLCTIDLFIFSIPSAAITTVVLKALLGDALGKQISVSRGKMINVKDVVFDSSHILGRHTVHILPYGTAKLNPGDEIYCIPSNEIGSKSIYVPIVLNNTIPSTISLSRYDFDTDESVVHHYKSSEIHRATEIGHGKQDLEHYFVSVRHPGVYKLDSIISKDGLDVRLYNRLVYVFVCPTAEFLPARNPDYCSGEKDTLQFRVTGVPPLRVEYSRYINDRRAKLKMDRIQPENLDSPLAKIPGGLENAEPSFFTSAHHSSFNWGASSQLTINLQHTFENTGEYKYMIDRVIDGAGNVMEPVEPAVAHFDVHKQPSVSFECKATDPVKLLIGEQAAQLPLSLKGDSPWELEYEYLAENADSSAAATRHKTKISTDKSALQARAPGEYKLLRVSDKFCRGDILFPSTCQVIQPPLPAVGLSATPIPSECAGDTEIGMRFAADFQGTPPFALEYRIIKQSGRTKTVVEKKREQVDRSRHVFTYLPKSSGEYIYEFTVLDDRNYKNRNPEIQSIKQVVHPQPDAKFTGSARSSLRTCVGDDIELPVELSGTGPFVLTWALSNQTYTDTITGNRHIIHVPRLSKAGHHVVSLVKIQDANDCIKDLEARDVIIDVRRDRPKVFFYTDEQEDALALVAEGEKARLPLRLTGEGPWKVTYRNVDKDPKKIRKLVLRDPNAEIEVADKGQYELLSVEDAICKGDALPPLYTVQWIDKPKLSFVEDMVSLRDDGVYERQAVCEGVSDAVDILFQGQGPFYTSYSQHHILPGKRDGMLLSTEEVRSGVAKTWIGMQTQQGGKYRYSFNEISDQRYMNPLKIRPPLVVEQTVHSLPVVKFASKSRYERTVCVGDTFDSDDVGPIWLELKGQAPFTVRLGLKHQSEPYGKTVLLEDIQTNKYKVELQDEVLAPGQYDLQLLSVRDANGCTAGASGPETLLTIDAQDIATIVPTETCAEHCVGDTLEYSLSGIGPFTISYQFNGRNEKIKSATSRLTMIADKPGNLTIVSVGDQRNKCRSFPKGMTKVIHPVPSSLVSGGREVIESIQEGEMVQATVDLIGTPPFDFEWQRSETIWDSNKKRYFKGDVLERHTVHNVEDHHYAINTSVEGVIEVVRLKDRYCQYPRQHL